MGVPYTVEMVDIHGIDKIVGVVVECELYCKYLDEYPIQLSTGRKKYAEDSDSNQSTRMSRHHPQRRHVMIKEIIF